MSFLSDFSHEIATILPFARSEQFTTKLAEMFKRLVPTNNVMIVAYHQKHLPRIEYNDNPPGDRTTMVKQFTAGAFLLDLSFTCFPAFPFDMIS